MAAVGGQQLFIRDASLLIGPVLITTRDPTSLLPVPTLRVTFKIVRTLSSIPDSAVIAAFNLSKEHRSSLQQKHMPCTLLAGYVGQSSQLFQGALSFSESVLDGTDWVSKFILGDGIDKVKSARVDFSSKAPTPVATAFNAVIAQMGLIPGNIAEKAAASLRATMTQYANGVTLSGKGSDMLDKLSKAIGRVWFIQNGAVNILGPQETLLTAGKLVSLRPGSGMIGSPQAGEHGILKVRSLLMPDLLPGHLVQIQSNAVAPGNFRIEKVTFLGDTWGGEWYADLEVKPLAVG